MTQGLEWRRLYGTRETVFVRGVARGDYYPASGDVYRVRFWPRFRLQGGSEVYVLGEERARQSLLELAQQALGAEGEG